MFTPVALVCSCPGANVAYGPAAVVAAIIVTAEGVAEIYLLARVVPRAWSRQTSTTCYQPNASRPALHVQRIASNSMKMTKQLEVRPYNT